jgi:mono/diheme cytochrome c family protein
MSPDPANIPVKQNDAEPSVLMRAVPIWLVVVFGGLFYWSQLFLDGHAGGFSKDVYAPYHSYDEVFAANPKSAGDDYLLLGRVVFDKSCVACHQATGLGKEGVAPPLVGSEWVIASSGDRIARIVLNGLTGPITVKGTDYNLTMPPWKDNFSDKELGAVLSYVRSQWGNKASLINPEVLAAARKEAHNLPMTSPELQQIPLH